ncbi:SIMPL domain-containing protein [Pseudoblastomonas halimionae]|uniref:DUF541 domain-containing protein n=1 Tax=Alteriqipengyuania halimionae TaxID=1926630 RepID=A0A6I4U3V9_9SPHN|nr:SIMPL domain-containing protein [Alteriqipengyuania halimionae]MXP09131.1 DUF541 domain-containing protein [Alteriqipengyuania halimionae]
MNRMLIALAATTAAIVLPGSPVEAGEIQIQATNPVVELSITETVRSAPDVAQIGAGVQTQAPTAREAVQANSQAMNRLVERLRALGIERKDIQTSNFNLNPQYNYNRETGEQTFSGYMVTNQVSVTLRDLKRAGEVLDALVGAGANNIYGPNFMLDDDAATKKAARKGAFEKGRAQAEEYARMAGYSGVRLLEVSESFSSYGPPPPQPVAMARAESKDAAADVPVEPGEVGTSASLLLKFEMTR